MSIHLYRSDLELNLNHHQQYKTSYLLNYIKQLIIDMICENNISRGDRDCIHCISFPGRLFRHSSPVN